MGHRKEEEDDEQEKKVEGRRKKKANKEDKISDANSIHLIENKLKKTKTAIEKHKPGCWIREG